MIDKYLQDLTPEQKAMAKRRDLYEKVCEKANKGLKKYDTIAESHLLEWGILAAIDTLFITDLEFEEIDGEIVPSDTKYDVNTLANDLKTEVKETRTFTDIIYHYTLKDEYKLPADVSYQSNHTIDHGDKSGKRANNIKMLLSANDKETLLHELNATTEKVAYQYCNECEKEWKKGDPIPEGCLGMTPLSIVTGHIIRTKYIDEAVPVKLPQTYTIEKSRLGSFDTYPCTATYKVKADEKTIFSKSFVIGESVIQDKELESIQDSFNPEYYDIEEEKIQITYPTVIDTFRGTYNYCFYQSEEDPETVSNQTVRNYTLPSEVTIYKTHDLSDALHDTQDYVRLRRALIKYAKIGDKLSEELPDYLHKGMQKVNGKMCIRDRIIGEEEFEEIRSEMNFWERNLITPIINITMAAQTMLELKSMEELIFGWKYVSDEDSAFNFTGEYIGGTLKTEVFDEVGGMYTKTEWDNVIQRFFGVFQSLAFCLITISIIFTGFAVAKNSDNPQGRTIAKEKVTRIGITVLLFVIILPLILIVMAVSYTHLDVYKRQV